MLLRRPFKHSPALNLVSESAFGQRFPFQWSPANGRECRPTSPDISRETSRARVPACVRELGLSLSSPGAKG